MNRARVRSFGKGAGLVVCLALLAAGAASCFWSFTWFNRADCRRLELHGGALTLQWRPPEFGGSYPGTLWRTESSRAALRWEAGLSRGPQPDRIGALAWTAPYFWTRLTIPLWFPLALVVLLTARLWWIDRPHSSGCRRCGYDLTGNRSGRCPECGTPCARPS